HDVVVVAGFQGRTGDGDITTIGRGGSDTTAADFGASLRAESVEILTDVEGMMTADQSVVKDASQIDVVTYTETRNLAYQGAKVIHPRAVEIAMHAEIPSRIQSNYTDDVGTLITSSRGKEKGIDIPDRLVTGIAHIDDISQIDVKIDNQDIEKQALVFEKMEEANIYVDLIKLHLSNVIYT